MKSYDNEIKIDFDREVLQPEKTQCLTYSLLLQQERKQIHNFEFFLCIFFLQFSFYSFCLRFLSSVKD